jgi:hypothetical protein
VETKAPDYDAVYFDSNELLAHGWPDPSVQFLNFIYLCHRWGIEPFIPAPVLDETEAHWSRSVQAQASRLSAAKRDFERIVRPITAEVVATHSEVAELRTRYREFRDGVLHDFRIDIAPYPDRDAQYFFELATRYVMPFAKDGEGKGYQDSVILKSVLDHLESDDKLRGLLITRDEGLKQAELRQFLPQFDTSRLRFTALAEAFEDLVKYHIDQTVVQPWAEERENALAAVRAMEPALKEFLASHLSESMLRAGEFSAPATPVKLVSVDSVEVAYVDTPVPESDADANRDVRLSVTASAMCTALLRKDRFFYTALFGHTDESATEPASPPELAVGNASWNGGIRATARIRDRRFLDVVFESLASAEELRSSK